MESGKARKGSVNHFYKDGLFSGWREYRYKKGKRKSAPHKRLLNPDKRRFVVSRLMEILDDFELTKFEHQATCRHGMRIALIKLGHSWASADQEAALLVEEALRAIGAVWPKWENGQRYYTISPDFCVWCKGPLDEHDRTRAQRFCCVECARMAYERREGRSRSKAGMDAVMGNAQRLIWRDRQPKRDCKHCGKLFKPRYKHAEFCSSVCSGKARGRQRIIRERPCRYCGDVFQPQKQSQELCSPRCQGQEQQKLIEEKLAGEVRLCGCCGVEFTPKRFNAVHCSVSCRSRAYKLREKAKKKALADPNIIRLPVPDPRPLTPELVDSWLQVA